MGTNTQRNIQINEMHMNYFTHIQLLTQTYIHTEIHIQTCAYMHICYGTIFVHNDYVLLSLANKKDDSPITEEKKIEQERQTRRILGR